MEHKRHLTKTQEQINVHRVDMAAEKCIPEAAKNQMKHKPYHVKDFVEKNKNRTCKKIVTTGTVAIYVTPDCPKSIRVKGKTVVTKGMCINCEESAPDAL